MMYLDDLAEDIHEAAHGTATIDDEDKPLYRMYAVLALAKGQDVTAEDVHNAWAAFVVAFNPGHPWLIPFYDLEDKIKQLDYRYVDAIRYVMMQREAKASTG